MTTIPEKELDLRPFCTVCNWRMGGIDSWTGAACKCGKSAPTFRELFRTWNAAQMAIETARSK